MVQKASAISLFSYPKVNLTLDILKKDASGFHEIRTVFHELSEPRDELIIEEIGSENVEVTSDNPKLPVDETNTVMKAAALLKEKFGIKEGAKIFIKKCIPFTSGLGGGASNAAAALKGLTTMWSIDCCGKAKNASQSVRTHTSGEQIYPHSLRTIHASECVLFEIAASVGMDCPFFMNGGTALGVHFGEKITRLPPLAPQIQFEVIDTAVEVSSSFVYEQIDMKYCGKNLEKTEKLISALRTGDTAAVIDNLHNDFEELVFASHPLLLKKKREIESTKPGRVLLCGSGGCLLRVYS